MKDWFKIRELNHGDFFVYQPDGSMAYAYIEGSLNQWNFIVIEVRSDNTIVRQKIGKNFELYRPEQSKINKYDLMKRIFTDTKYGKKYFDYL